MRSLDDIRKVIDDCDRDLVEVFERRLIAVSEVLNYKKKTNLPILQSNREKEVLDKVKSYLKNDEFTGELESLYRHILKTSRQLQSKKLFPFNIVLIGFMGSGKTSVAKQLSKLLEMEYVDTDDLIIKKCGKTINEIFAIHGESYFRELETQAIKTLEEYKNTIISSGGGVVLTPENIISLKQNGIIIWLKAKPKEIYSRISCDKTRPLLQKDFTLDYLESALEERLTLYKKSMDIEIDTDGRDVEDICNQIIENLIK